MKYFNRKNIITFIGLLLVLNILQAFVIFNRPSEKSSSVNSSTEPAPGGKEIPTDQAIDLIKGYREAQASDHSIYKTTGWAINKKAIENIFANKTFNALNFDLVDDGITLKLILQGRQMDIADPETRVGNSIFIVQTMCPNDCSNVNK